MKKVTLVTDFKRFGILANIEFKCEWNFELSNLI
jgi:hypothetical protein